MCMMDWRIGRLIRSVPYNGQIGFSLKLPANQQRIGLLITIAPDTGPLLDNDWGQISFTGYPSINFTENNSPMMLSVINSGDLVTRECDIASGQGGVVVSAIEFLMPEDWLAAGVEQFKSEYSQWAKLN